MRLILPIGMTINRGVLKLRIFRRIAKIGCGKYYLMYFILNKF
jgi:hypothetical protein